ncbi:hypothetical protein BD779DRAFT_1445528 [Infundibulicybe gibba]|nr:hypothetical protein BD779DRAFT_1445528 [Infundibulicybe gibba]
MHPLPPVDILILGAGWTSTFLIPLCAARGLTIAATTRSGDDSTIPFTYDPDSDDPAPYTALPAAHTVLVTFPILGAGRAKRLVRLYEATHAAGARYIQLGATSIWDGTRKNPQPSGTPIPNKWYDRHTPYLPTERAIAEDELLSLSPGVPTTVLNLAGLWGGTRSPRNWVSRVAPSKEALGAKGSLHIIHGLDIARAILAVHARFDRAAGQRWILTDGRVYDWWDLASAWGTTSSNPQEQEERGPQARWVRELMAERDVRALPRNVEMLGRAMDSREFWTAFGFGPIKALRDEWPPA